MAEIRSTIDIVMERTRNLSLSDEERAALKKKELRDVAGGLALKIAEGVLRPEEALEQAAARPGLDKALAERLIERLSLEGDQDALFETLHQLAQGRLSPLLARLTELASASRQARESGAGPAGLLEALKAKGTFGPALVPNPKLGGAQGPDFPAELEALKNQMLAELAG